MRIFAGDRVKSLMERMGMPDDEPIEHPWVTKSIQDAQSKVEARNFDIRKNLLEYDDVMNEQRKTVYKIRQQLLLGIYTPEHMDDDGKPTGKLRTITPLERLGDEVKQAITDMLIHHGTPMPKPGEDVKRPKTVEEIEEIFDMDQLRNDIYQFWGYRFDFKDSEGKDPKGVYDRLMEEIPSSLTMQRERLLDLIDGIIGAVVEESCPANKPPEDWDWKGIRTAFNEHFAVKPPEDFESHHDVNDLAHTLYQHALETLEAREKEMGTELLCRVFRHFYLEEIDKQWVEHLTNMEHLRDGIGLRGYGQRDPKQEYKKEGYDIFVNMMAGTSSNVVTKLMRVRLQKETDIERMEREDAERHARALQSMQLRHGGEIAEGEENEAPPAQQRRPQPAPAPRRSAAPQIDRNDLCPCGSGEMFKKCHGAALEEEGSDDAQA
jgi:preprotein translocase subunit SecA